MVGSILIAILVVSSIAASLAALLAVSEYFLANHGDCEITVNEDRKITVQGGDSLLSSLVAEKLFIPSACGGRGTCGLCKVKVLEGDEVRINGPYGDFRLSESDAPIVFIAGGSGMAPIKCMLHHMKNTANPRRAVYYFGANDPDELFLGELMSRFESDLADYRHVPVVARPKEGQVWAGQTGLVTEAVQRGLEKAADYEAYLCRQSRHDRRLDRGPQGTRRRGGQDLLRQVRMTDWAG